MNLETAADRIDAALKNLQTAIGEPVFDEWAIVEKTEEGWKLRQYGGSRHDEFVADFGQDVAALRETLDPDKRIAVVLRYFEGLSLSEVAEITGTDPNTLKVRLFRARKELFEKLEPGGGNE